MVVMSRPQLANKRFTRHKARLAEALYSDAFERFITTLILLNAVILGALTYQYDQGNSHIIRALVAVDLMIVVVFVFEIALKIYALGPKFFKTGWNVFDFFIVSVGVVGVGYPLTIIRSLRVLRALRLVTRVPSMKVVVESFLRALPGIGSVLGVLLLIIFIFSVIGNRMFGGVAPDLFGTLHGSAFTLFKVLTLEGWPDISDQIMAHYRWSGAFFVAYIGLNSFVVLNLMIAVIINAMHKEYDAHAEEEREDILEEIQALRREINTLLNAKKDRA